MPATAKLTIASKDDVNLQVTAQYNPRELLVSQTIDWHEHQILKKDVADEVDVEFGGMKPETLQLELLFDGFENQGRLTRDVGSFAVMNQVQALKEMASVRFPGDRDPDRRRPHYCLVVWGDKGTLGVPPLRCVIESIAVKYLAFADDGTVLRASVTVGLKAADPVAIARRTVRSR